MKKAQLLERLDQLSACEGAVAWVRRYDGSPSQMWAKCNRADWMLWLAAKADVDRKTIVTIACLCARRALKYVKQGDKRPLVAIKTAEAWVAGKAMIKQVRAASYASYTAATSYAADAADAADAAAAYAAYASYAAYAADAAAAATSYAADAAGPSKTKELKIMSKIVRKHIKWSDVAKGLEAAKWNQRKDCEANQ